MSNFYGGPQVPRQNFLSHGKTFFLTAKLSFSRQNFLSHGKTFFLTAKLSFFTAKLSFSRQNFLSHGKTFFLTAKLSFSRQNFLSHGKTFFSKKQQQQHSNWREKMDNGRDMADVVYVILRSNQCFRRFQLRRFANTYIFT